MLSPSAVSSPKKAKFTTISKTSYICHQLAPIDANLKDFPMALLCIYPPPNLPLASYNLEKLQSSFYEMIDCEFPICKGTFVSITNESKHSLSVLQPVNVFAKDRIPFEIHISSTATIKSACNDLSYQFYFSNVPISSKNLVTVKATKLSDGGLVLGLSINHVLMDAQAAMIVIETWAKYYCGKPLVIRPLHDRSLVKGNGNTSKFTHPEYYAPLKGESTKPVPVETSFNVFHVDTFMLQYIQLLKSSGSKNSSIKPQVTTKDMISALLLILISDARGLLTQDIEIKFGAAINGRTILKPSIPMNYIGNVIFNAISSFQSTDIRPTDYSYSIASILFNVAEKIRKSINQQSNPDYLIDSINFVENYQETNIHPLKPNLQREVGKDLILSSWVGISTLYADFGAGKPLYIGPPHNESRDGLCFLLDKVDNTANSGFDLMVVLETKALNQLKDRWSTFWTTEHGQSKSLQAFL